MTHARSEITLGSGAGGHERRVRNVARGPGPAAAKDALVAVAALSLGPLFTQVRRVITSSEKERESATNTRSRSHLTLVYHKTWCRATESTDDVNN